MDEKKKRVSLTALIKPHEITIGLCCLASQVISEIHFFIEETMRGYNIDYRVGRVELKRKEMWLCPYYPIKDCLEDGDELVAYSVDYGFKSRSVLKSGSIELIEGIDVDELFIKKKKSRRKRGENKPSTSSKQPRKNSMLSKMAETARRIEEEFYSQKS